MQEPMVSEALLEAVASQYKQGKLSIQRMKENLSEHQLIYLIDQGAYHILAHKKRQKKRNELMKVGLDLLRKCSTDPELAEKVGMGKRVDLS